MNKKLRVVGAHRTGKTTIAEWVSKTYDVPLIPEQSRLVLEEMGKTLPEVRSSQAYVDEFQRRIVDRQIEAEKNHPDFVSDRSACNLAYLSEHASCCAKVMRSRKVTRWLRDISQDGLVVFCRPHVSMMNVDEVNIAKTMSWEEVVRVDGAVKFILESNRIRYLPLFTDVPKERKATVAYLLDRVW